MNDWRSAVMNWQMKKTARTQERIRLNEKTVNTIATVK